MNRPERLAIVAVLLAGISIPTLPGCGGSPAPPEPQAEVVFYTVRGRVVSLPDPARPAAELVVHHEPIPSFMSGGEVVGMAAMQMPFPTLREAVSLAGLVVGQAVTLTFEVEYDPESRAPAAVIVTAIEPLPDGLTLTIDTDG